MNRWFSALLATCILSGCPAVDPDKGVFSCSSAGDCASGFTCRPQFGGGGRCFRDGLCRDEELCNGIDDTCDGRVDESFPTAGEACSTTHPGVCAAGRLVCVEGVIGCEGVGMPGTEDCNGLDDDCDGSTDEDFDLSTDPSHCGACGRSCAAGTGCRSGRCVENRCDDRIDNDLDGLTDCDDEHCLGLVCEALAAPAPRCGLAPFVPDAGTPDGGPNGADGGSDGGMRNDDGGLDGGSLDGGAADGGLVPGCYFPETACDDGIDNDGDGEADCLDADCEGRRCFSGQVCTGRTCPGPG